MSGGPGPSRVRRERAERAARLLQRLVSLGLSGVTRCTLTRNHATMVSYRGDAVRIQEAFADAPDDVVRAIVTFIRGRGTARQEARRTILAFPVPRDATRPRRRERTHPDDAAIAQRLQHEHARLNREHFSASLGEIRIHVSRRMRRKLGHYVVGSAAQPASIAISRRHLRRHGWGDVTRTLLHEMVHQWQDETGRRLGHGREFKQKAAEVGAAVSMEPGRAAR